MMAACELAPPATETAPDEPRLGELDQVARAHFTADQDEVTGRARRLAGSAEMRQDCVGHLADVAGPLGQLRARQRLDHRGLCLRGLPHCRRGVGAAVHRRHGGPDQRDVGGDQRPDVDDGGFIVAAGAAQPLGQRGPLRRDRGERVPDLVGGGADRRVQVSDMKPARRRALGDGQSPEPHGWAHRACRMAMSLSAPMISAVEAAPGSSCPTLRGPR